MGSRTCIIQFTCTCTCITTSALVSGLRPSRDRVYNIHSCPCYNYNCIRHNISRTTGAHVLYSTCTVCIIILLYMFTVLILYLHVHVHVCTHYTQCTCTCKVYMYMHVYNALTRVLHVHHRDAALDGTVVIRFH